MTLKEFGPGTTFNGVILSLLFLGCTVLLVAQDTRQFLRDEKGIEAYYSIAITPWAHLSPDFQIVHGAQRQNLLAAATQGAALKNIDTAVVLGLRLGLVF